jgi:hypothetical protein
MVPMKWQWPWATGEEVAALRVHVARLEATITKMNKSLHSQAEQIAGIGGRIDDVTAEKRVTHRPKSWSAAKSLMGEGN